MMSGYTRCLDIAYLQERLSYNPVTGLLFWKNCVGMPAAWLTRWADKEAFTAVTAAGYRQGSVNGLKLYSHRVAWALHYGEWPDGQIDHLNGVKTDNRIENLRAVNNQENNRNMPRKSNNTSGVNGVCWHKKAKKWMAYVVIDGKQSYLGVFDNLEDARVVRAEASKLHGFSERHGVH